MQGVVNDRRRSQIRMRQGQRRRIPRVCVPFDGYYESPERSAFVSPGGNINLRGAFLATLVPDEPGTLATVRVGLPGSVIMLKIRARVVWSNANPSCGPVGMGLRFDALQPWQLKRIGAAMLRSAGFRAFFSLDAAWLRERAGRPIVRQIGRQ